MILAARYSGSIYLFNLTPFTSHSSKISYPVDERCRCHRGTMRIPHQWIETTDTCIFTHLKFQAMLTISSPSNKSVHKSPVHKPMHIHWANEPIPISSRQEHQRCIHPRDQYYNFSFLHLTLDHPNKSYFRNEREISSRI